MNKQNDQLIAKVDELEQKATNLENKGLFHTIGFAMELIEAYRQLYDFEHGKQKVKSVE